MTLLYRKMDEKMRADLKNKIYVEIVMRGLIFEKIKVIKVFIIIVPIFYFV